SRRRHTRSKRDWSSDVCSSDLFSMHHATGVFPKIQARTCDQDLVSHAGLKTMTTFIDAIGVGHMAEDRLGQFVPTGARHRTGSILGALSAMLIGGGGRSPESWTQGA